MEIMATERQKGILISGGRGFVGRSATKLLRRSSYRVLSLDQSAVETRQDREGEELICDIRDRAQLRSIFERAEIGAIIHLAAILPTAAQREPVLATQVNVEGSLSLLEMAREFGVRRFVFGSSLSVYGTCSAEQVASETDRAAPEDLYGAAKVYVEQLGDVYRQAHGLEFVSLRIGRVVGPGANSSTSAWRSEIFECLAADSAEIHIPYAESERILLVHVEDVATMLRAFIQAERLGHSVYNAACESVIVGELKSAIETINPRVRVRLGGQTVVGNPRRVDWSRLEAEFGVRTVPVFERLRRVATDEIRAAEKR